MTREDPYTATRLELQRVATHVLARARFEADGRFGLRVTPSGIATPSFGPEGNVIRMAGDTLIREFRDEGGARSTTITVTGRSLRELGTFVGVDLASAFSVGGDTPDLGHVDTPVTIDRAAAAEVMSWFCVAAVALDRVLPETSEPSVVQVWPEHFDLGVDVATAHGRVNLGASPGDADHPDPYLYVSPWTPDRPGDPTFWNAPFGALTDRRSGSGTPDQIDHALEFFGRGLRLLGIE